MTLGCAIYAGIGALAVELHRCANIENYARDEYDLQGRGSPLPEAMDAALALLTMGEVPAPPQGWENAEYTCTLAHSGRVLEVSAKLARDRRLYVWTALLSPTFVADAARAAGAAKVLRPGVQEGTWVC